MIHEKITFRGYNLFSFRLVKWDLWEKGLEINKKKKSGSFFSPTQIESLSSGCGVNLQKHAVTNKRFPYLGPLKDTYLSVLQENKPSIDLEFICLQQYLHLCRQLREIAWVLLRFKYFPSIPIEKSRRKKIFLNITITFSLCEIIISIYRKPMNHFNYLFHSVCQTKAE